MNKNEIFARAAEVLMEKGHCKGTVRDANGAYCAIGAIGTALDELNAGYGTCHLADEAAERLGLTRLGLTRGSTFVHPLARWNDEPERTAEDVILMFKELAVEVEG